MKKLAIGCALIVLVGIGLAVVYHPESKWSGTDESVVKRFAEEAGSPPREPYINVAQGDMALFCFLMAGMVGGFVSGYYYRELFPPRTKHLSDSSHV